MVLDMESKNEIAWWKTNIHSSYNVITIPPPEFFINTDASLLGWGCAFDSQTTGGQWSDSEASLHINVLELKAILFSIKSFLNSLSNVHIRIRSDSSTAVHYINNLGGVKSIPCHKVTKDIWLWAIKRGNLLSAEFLPGQLNVVADKASRIFDENTEWQISVSVFDKISDNFGPFDIDLFASRLNTKCKEYCSWKPDPNAKFIDAFSACWNEYEKPYMFPPFSIIMKTLQKICQDQTPLAVIVTPLWTTQPWFPKMMRMLIASPLVLPMGVLTLPFKKLAVHKQHKNLRLIACCLSGISIRSKEFRNRLSLSSVHHGETQPNFNMRDILKNGFISAVEGKLIPCLIMR